MSAAAAGRILVGTVLALAAAATASVDLGPGAMPALAASTAVAVGPPASCTGPCATGQVVSVTIARGPLTLMGGRAPVVVATGPDGRGAARVSDLRVTDLRGVDDGWTLTARVASVLDSGTGRAVLGARLEVVASCTRTAGPLMLETGDPALVEVGATVGLCVVPVASRGSLAGGEVSAYADITVRGAPPNARLRLLVETALI